ncbi:MULTISPECIES: hypothetical protein [Bacillus amyloliquefaciens group]|uniref:hypothetical protein n=1 Tax=Bacillus amyloliquefaciens group TaxID=1938374 RepID=UPI0002059456|nr:hypothetical protein [Bacillus amyloliquefaciens]AIW35038.1 hypothetical protein KS08_15875 [Bacillus subtilis]AEB25377.1 hypothetical protein BAMTA208_16125 [Bacillus amyloliquefaciens TA208]AEK90407.1 hypothetical protein BAXH7_03293 [Bacillus amyloliquefaciens XH7]MEC1831346.1 hypothetical protein [Bacillus amyloliquefaciens]MEC1835008.1 hypothetical protein [Bacillus amyloliquefaciens]
MKYKIQTPNKYYNGVTAGVSFSSGVAEIESKEVRDDLVNNFGYTDITPEAKAPKKPARKSSGK